LRTHMSAKLLLEFESGVIRPDSHTHRLLCP
jgi:hypothetical protein